MGSGGTFYIITLLGGVAFEVSLPWRSEAAFPLPRCCVWLPSPLVAMSHPLSMDLFVVLVRASYSSTLVFPYSVVTSLADALLLLLSFLRRILCHRRPVNLF